MTEKVFLDDYVAYLKNLLDFHEKDISLQMAIVTEKIRKYEESWQYRILFKMLGIKSFATLNDVDFDLYMVKTRYSRIQTELTKLAYERSMLEIRMVEDINIFPVTNNHGNNFYEWVKSTNRTHVK